MPDTNNHDPELPLRLKAARAVNRDSIEELIQLLRGRGWTTARQIRAVRPAWNERFIRLLASSSKGQVVSGPGMPGYCRLEEVADDELQHAGNSLISQGRDMQARGIAFLQRFALRLKAKGDAQ